MKRNRRRSRIGVWFVIVALGAALFAVAWHGRKPWQLMTDQRAEMQSLDTQLGTAKERNRQQIERQKRLNTPGGVEAEARRQGWVKDGETIVNLPDK